ncbi:MAG: hypothetical protein IJC51_01455 [Eggerthellaceae bacterium]|nr:hypothetical protein [Eggerthellaceae bacterium]
MSRHSGTERLRSDLNDYFGTAMFNGNPMAMMELEEAQRASDDELRELARRHGIDPKPYYDSPGGASPRDSGFHASGVSASIRTESIGPGATRFFERSAQHDTGFFANHGRSLRDRALRDETLNDYPPNGT